MESKNKALFLEVVCLAILSWACIANTLNCPQKVYAELMKDVVINCGILKLGDVYWYRGNSTKTSPIARIENGRKQVLRDSGHYNIDGNGSLIVMNLGEQFFGVYSVLHFSSSEKHETGQSEIQAVVKPEMLCPSIMECSNCSVDCILKVKKAGNITCSIGRTRPPVEPQIFLDSEKGISVLGNTSHKTFDVVTETWNTSSIIQYEWSTCNSSLRIRCGGENLREFELSDSFATIQSDPCVTRIKDSTFPAYGIFIIIAVLALGVLGLTFLLRRKVFSRSRRNDSDGEGEMSHLMEKDYLGNDFFKSLIAHLKAEYASLCNSECLLEGVNLSSEALFNGDFFSLNNMNNVETVTSGADLIQQLFEKTGRYVFITDDGYSKKLFTQYLCSCVSDDMPNRRIILYLSFDGLHSEMSVADAIVKKLNMQGKCSVEDMQKVVQNHRCLILMDEIDKLISEEGTQGTKCETNVELTINELLKNKDVFNKFPNLGCLFVFKSMTYLQPPYAKPDALVKLRHLNSESLKLYIRNVFRYYAKQRAVASQSDSEKGVGYSYVTADTVKTDNSNRKEDKAVVLTTAFLEETCITKEPLKNDQIRLPLFIHVIMSEIAKETEKENIDLCFYRRSCLAKMILNCLKVRYSFKPLENISFESLEMELGEISLGTKLEDAEFNDKSSLPSVHKENKIKGLIETNKFETVLSHGLLYLIEDDTCTLEVVSDANMCSSSTKNVVFCHSFVEEYLAAQAIATSKEASQRFYKSSCWQTDERMGRVLQFIFATKKDVRSRLVKSFMEQKKWDIFADCLFESESSEEYIKLLTTALPPNAYYVISFHKLCCYFHRLAVLHFCKNLSHIQIVPDLLIFTGNCQPDFFRQLKIPKVPFLLIKEMNFQNENDFIQMFDPVLKRDMTFSLQFMKCDFPPQVSKDALQRLVEKISKLSEKCTVLRTDTIKDAPADPNRLPREGWEKFNFETGSWD